MRIIAPKLSDQRNEIFGLQGAPNSGKTTAALTFPNVKAADYDKKLPPGIPCWEFWNDDFIHELMGTAPPTRPNRRDALIVFIDNIATTLTEDDTLLLDSWTMVMNEFDQKADEEPTEYYTKKSNYTEVDGWAIGAHRITYSAKVFQKLKKLKCRVVVTFHEQDERSKEGNYTGRKKPLVSGQFADQLAGHCGNFFRQGFHKELGYCWKVKSDDDFDAVISPRFKIPEGTIYIPAYYNELMKFAS